MKINHTDSGAASAVAAALSPLPNTDSLAIVCIGSDRSAGDSLGPFVGTTLCEAEVAATVYGTLDEPVHAGNLDEIADKLLQFGFVLAVDASLGKTEDIGCISVNSGSIRPGASVNKILPAVGDAHIKGIVNVGGFMEYLVLQNTRLSLIVKMAKVISAAILEAVGTKSQKEAAAS